MISVSFHKIHILAENIKTKSQQMQSFSQDFGIMLLHACGLSSCFKIGPKTQYYSTGHLDKND